MGHGDVFGGAHRAAEYDDESAAPPLVPLPTRRSDPPRPATGDGWALAHAGARPLDAPPQSPPTVTELSPADVPTPARGVPAVRQTAAEELAAVNRPPRPAASGWRALVRRATFGAIAPAAGAAELAQADDAAAARARWRGPKTVVVANPKGGAGKTPTTIGLAATFGDIRGGAVLAWDANETLGTLGLRASPVPHRRTVVDLLHQISAFETRMARRGDLADIVRPQESGNFHVLASDENPRRMSQIDAAAFARLHAVLFRYYDVLVIDTGNNPRADNFTAALEVADALVIPVSWAEDKVVTAGGLIDQLEEMHRGDLVRRAVTVVTGAPGSQTSAAQIATWRRWFEERTAAVVEVPIDAHIAGGGPMTFDRLAPATRRAYLGAAAAVGSVFTASDQRAREHLMAHRPATSTTTTTGDPL